MADETYKPEDIRSVKVEEIPTSGPDPSKELQALSDPMAPLKAEKGWFGHVFGARSEKSGNIAGLLVIICVGFVGCSYFIPPKVPQDVTALTPKDFVSSLLSLVTLALGYLFGRNSRSD